MAPSAVRRSFAASQHALALTLLLISLLMVLVFQAAEPASNLWLSTVALVPAIGLLAVVERVGTVLWSLAYLLVGGIGVYFYALGMLSQMIPVGHSDGFSFLAVKTSLMMVGGVVLGVRAGIAGAILGYVTAELAVGLALVHDAVPLRFDLPAFVILLATIMVIALIGVRSPQQRWVVPRLQRAARDEHLATVRYRIEVNAAMLMHDTVLNHLASIADSPAPELPVTLRAQMAQDVNFLMGEEWLRQSPDVAHGFARGDWRQSGLFAAIRESRLFGLTITTTGDLAAVSRLGREASTALGLAVKQCLVNVLKHSGVREAEVAVYGSDSEVSVMVVDNGCGFDEAATGVDRLGLRSSVRKRIELIGGSVNVWSSPGRGASIMIKIPIAGESSSLAPASPTGAS